MKANIRYKKIFLRLGVILLTLQGCVDLEQPPISVPVQEEKAPGQTLTTDELKARANQLYIDLWGGGTVFNDGNYGYNTRIMQWNIASDETVTGKPATNRLGKLDRIDLDLPPLSTKDDGMPWAYFYKTINTASTLIMESLRTSGIAKAQYADSIKATAEFDKVKYEELRNAGAITEDDEVMQLMGEGYFMRALSYFHLVRYYGDVPCYADHTNKTGINGEVGVKEQTPRSPVKDIYEKMIIRDLELAALLLPKNSRIVRNGKSSSERPSSWAAKAMLADVYLTMAGWPLKQVDKYSMAANVAKDIMTNSGLSLTPDYKDLWKEAKKEEANEHIFALHHYGDSEKTFSNYGKSYYAEDEKTGGNTGWADVLMDSSFFERWPSDLRRNFVAITQLDKDGVKTPWRQSLMQCPPINKYRDYNQGGNTLTTPASAQSLGITPIYRYAQVLLIYAEAANQAAGGPNTDILNAINLIRTRGGAEPIESGLTKEEFDEVVFKENSYELFAEGKRWFQLVRKERVVKENQYNYRVKKSLQERGITTEMAAQSNKGYLWPIPSDVITTAAASGVTITQNPGY